MNFSQKDIKTVQGRVKTLERLSSMLASKGVNVVWGGTDCYTDGTTVHIAGFDAEQMLDINFYRKFLGYVAHEAFHPRYGMESIKKVAKKPKIWHSMLNIVEDGRINTMGAIEYPGVKHVLRDCYLALLNEGAFNAVEENQHPGHILTGWSIIHVVAHVMGIPEFEQNAATSKAVAEQIFSVAVIAKIEQLMSQIKTLTSSDECYFLVKKIMKVIDDAAKSEKLDASSEPASDSEQDEASSNSQDQDNQSNSQEEGEEGEQSESKEEQGNGQQSDGANESNEQSSNSVNDEQSSLQGKQNDSSVNESGSKIDSLQDIVNQLEEAGDSDLHKDNFADFADRLETQVRKKGSVNVKKAPFFWSEKGVFSPSQEERSKARQVGQKMRSIIQSMNDVPSVAGFVGDEPMVQNLARMQYGESRLFTDTAVEQAPNVAFHILLDASGSMSKSRLKVAKQSTVSTLLALDEIPGVSTAFSVFPLHDHDSKRLPVVTFKQHHEKARNVLHKFSYILANRNTPLADAMGVAIHDLKDRRELKKVILIVTDGEPDCVLDAFASYKLAKLLGMQVYGIAIGKVNSIKKFTDSYQVINDLSELPQAMQNITKQQTINY